MSFIRNERTKLAATALNSIAVATVVTAVLAPAASYLYGLSNPTLAKWWLLIGLAWFLAGLLIHTLAQMVLGRLAP